MSRTIEGIRIKRHYQYAGQTLRSDFPLPELVACDESGGSAFRVALATSELAPAFIEWSHDFLDPRQKHNTLTCERTAAGYRMHFPGVGTVAACANGDVQVHPHPETGMDAIRHVLLDQALPRLIAHRGELVLHAAVVSTLAGRKLLLIGDSGRGKSTLTGAFHASGRVVATDDGAVIRIIDGKPVAIPNYPSLRLLPDSLAHLFKGIGAATSPNSVLYNKQRIAVPPVEGRAPVHAILLLEPPVEDGAPPRLLRKSPGAACHTMMRHGFHLDLSNGKNHRRLLATGAEVAQRVPVYSLEYPRRYEALPDVLALLENLT